MKTRLTSKQLAFANHILDGIGNNAEAYRVAYNKHGCSIAQARTEGYRLRNHPWVDGYISVCQALLRERSAGRITHDEYIAGCVSAASAGEVVLRRIAGRATRPLTPIPDKGYFPPTPEGRRHYCAASNIGVVQADAAFPHLGSAEALPARDLPRDSGVQRDARHEGKVITGPSPQGRRLRLLPERATSEFRY